MKDEIIYCENIVQLREELVENGYSETDEDGNTVYTHGNTLTPIISNGAKSLALVRNNKLDLALFPSLTTLGTYEELFSNADSLALYKSVYPYDVPIEYTDEDGVVQSYLRPQKIGEFA